MTRQELRVTLYRDWFCGCGNPEEAAKTLMVLLRFCPLHNHRDELESMIPDVGLRHLVLYSLENHGLIEHGGSIGGSWLTDKGKAVLAALVREFLDEFRNLFEMSCVHGYAIDGEECPECAPNA